MRKAATGTSVVPPQLTAATAASGSASASAAGSSAASDADGPSQTAAASRLDSGADLDALAGVAPDPGTARFPLHVNARGVALGIIATVVLVYALQWARDFLVPLLLGILISYTLSPLVCWLERIKLPRVAGATLVTLAILCGSAFVMDTVHGEFQSILEELPTSGHKLSRLLSDTMHDGPSALQRIQAVAAELEQATTGAQERRVARKMAPVAAIAPAAPADGGIKVMNW